MGVLIVMLGLMTVAMLAVPRFVQQEANIRLVRVLIAVLTMLGFSLYLNTLVEAARNQTGQDNGSLVPLNEALQQAHPGLREVPPPDLSLDVQEEE